MDSQPSSLVLAGTTVSDSMRNYSKTLIEAASLADREPQHLLLFCAVPDGAGAMRMVASFAQYLVKTGYNVTVAHGRSTAQSAELPDSANRILAKLAQAGVKVVGLEGFRKRYSPELNRKLCDFVKENNVHGLIGFHPLDIKYALRVAGQCQRVCIVSTQNKHVFWGNPIVRRLKRFVYSQLIRRHATRVICTSQPLFDEVVDFGVAKHRCCIVPNGIPVDKYSPTHELDIQNVRAKLGVAAGDQLLMLSLIHI